MTHYIILHNNSNNNNNRFDFCSNIETELTGIPENEEIDSNSDNKSGNDSCIPMTLIMTVYLIMMALL